MLNSCSSTSNVLKFKTLSLGNFTKLTKPGNSVIGGQWNYAWSDTSIKLKEYESLNTYIDVSYEDLIYGTNKFNNGKYVLIYGTLGNNNLKLTNYGDQDNPNWLWDYQQSPFLQWLTGSSDIKEINYNQDIYIQNNFFNWWFNDYTRSPYKDVKIIMFIDNPLPSEKGQDAKWYETIQQCDPFQTWDQTAIMQMYYHQIGQEIGTLEFSELPYNWQLLEGQYIRNDETAIQYRDLISYIQTIRPDMQTAAGSGDLQNSGMIAFNTKSNKPLSVSLNDFNKPITNITSMGKDTAFTENQTNAPIAWQSIYNLYNIDNEDEPKWDEIGVS